MLRLYDRAPVAQVDRAAGFEPVGREFESLRARQKAKALKAQFNFAESGLVAMGDKCAVYPDRAFSFGLFHQVSVHG
jgi:hypothetical protein